MSSGAGAQSRSGIRHKSPCSSKHQRKACPLQQPRSTAEVHVPSGHLALPILPAAETVSCLVALTRYQPQRGCVSTSDGKQQISLNAQVESRVLLPASGKFVQQALLPYRVSEPREQRSKGVSGIHRAMKGPRPAHDHFTPAVVDSAWSPFSLPTAHMACP